MLNFSKHALFILKNISSSHLIIVAVLVLGIVSISFAYCIESLSHIIGFNGYAANGAFQLMNPLTRLADGQVIGKDFHFFHGAGVALIHFPLFALFGGDLFGSEMSRWFSSVLFFIVSGISFCYIWFKSTQNNFVKCLFSFLIVFLFTALFSEVITPSNSLLGIRTTMPLVVGVFLLIRSRFDNKTIVIKKVKLSISNMIIGLLLATTMLLGTEHGIAAILAYALIVLITDIAIARHKTVKSISSSIIRSFIKVLPTLGYTLISLITLATIISLGHPFKLLTYSLITVPADQFWYFGAEPQGYLDLTNLFLQLAHPTMWPLYILAGVTAILLYLAKRLQLLSKEEWFTFGFLIIYGLITLSSFLGYFSPTGQIVGVLRVFTLVDSIILTLILTKYLFHKNTYIKTVSGAACIALIMSVFIFSFLKLDQFPVKSLIRDTYHNIRGDHNTLLGVAWTDWTAEFKPYIDEAKKTSKYPLWSTYASIYERQNNIIHPSSGGYDYIIHALGDDARKQYTQDFINDKPELVTTLRPSYFGFEEWLWGKHSEFYRHLVENYEIVDQNDAHILWKRATVGVSSSSQRPLVIEGGFIHLPSSSVAGSQLIEVKVEYKTDKKWSKIPFLNKMPRYILKPINTTSTVGFSVPPSEDTWNFLVVLNNDTLRNDQLLNFFANGLLPNSHMSVERATFTPIHTDANETSYFTEQSIFLK